ERSKVRLEAVQANATLTCQPPQRRRRRGTDDVDLEARHMPQMWQDPAQEPGDGLVVGFIAECPDEEQRGGARAAAAAWPQWPCRRAVRGEFEGCVRRRLPQRFQVLPRGDPDLGEGREGLRRDPFVGACLKVEDAGSVKAALPEPHGRAAPREACVVLV